MVTTNANLINNGIYQYVRVLMHRGYLGTTFSFGMSDGVIISMYAYAPSIYPDARTPGVFKNSPNRKAYGLSKPDLLYLPQDTLERYAKTHKIHR